MVLNPTQKGQGNGKQLDDLASELGFEAQSIRANEGEAANHGIYYDDTEYDYMQHMRDLNQNSGGEVVFVEAESTKNKGKQKQSLEDALKDLDLEKSSQADIDEVMLPSKNLTRLSYEAQQDVPDAIKGFQPDMDPRLREALEALEDDAYVDDEDDDIFKDLTKDGEELDDYDFEEAQYYDEEEGYESDDTAKPTREYNDDVPQLVHAPGDQPEEGPSQDWMAEFQKFKQEEKAGRAKPPADPSQADVQTTWTTTTNGGMKKKKRKGALTDASNYSMTSSSLVRTDQLNLLDERFDKLEERYNEDMDDMASMSQASAASTVDGPVRGDFDGILDDFLGNYTKPGKRTNKKHKAQTGLQQLEEIRQGLGPARFRGPARKTTTKAGGKA